jgi:hypothetical protein
MLLVAAEITLAVLENIRQVMLVVAVVLVLVAVVLMQTQVQILKQHLVEPVFNYLQHSNLEVLPD